MKKITGHRTARQEALEKWDLSPTKDGGVFGTQLLLPPFCLHYARAPEWEETCIDFKKQKDCRVHFRGISFSLQVPDLISVLHEVRIVVRSSALSYLWFGWSRGSLFFFYKRWMELLMPSWFTSSTSHPADLILTNICGSDLWVRCLLMWNDVAEKFQFSDLLLFFCLFSAFPFSFWLHHLSM